MPLATDYKTTATKPQQKTVGDPNTSYESMRVMWDRSRAVLGGQSAAKAYDSILDTYTYKNLLIPFSPTMTANQYDFYRAEAELPGLVAQYARIIQAGLLRKEPIAKLKNEATSYGLPEDALKEVLNHISLNGKGLIHFLNEALKEEIETSRAWILVDYAQNTSEGVNTYPYCVVLGAETIINWRVTMGEDGTFQLKRVILRFYSERYDESEYHPTLVDTVHDYYLNDQGTVEVNIYENNRSNTTLNVSNGQVVKDFNTNMAGVQSDWKLIETVVPLMQGEPLTRIPVFPLNGAIEPQEPLLQPLIDREVALYNKVSRRNHLLYGAATYTPVVMSDMGDEEFDDIVSAGLGSWIKLRSTDKIQALETPTAALKDMEKAIETTVAEMARMGIRILSPDESNAANSGVALEIKNSSQTAQLGLLNTKVSVMMSEILAFMINWKYGSELTREDVDFTLSADFNPVPLGADWMRVITEWYQSGLIPRSTFLEIAKQNDILPSDYDDEVGLQEIQDDPLVDRNPTRINLNEIENQ
jgi:hypothetical protein